MIFMCDTFLKNVNKFISQCVIVCINFKPICQRYEIEKNLERLNLAILVLLTKDLL